MLNIELFTFENKEFDKNNSEIRRPSMTNMKKPLSEFGHLSSSFMRAELCVVHSATTGIFIATINL